MAARRAPGVVLVLAAAAFWAAGAAVEDDRPPDARAYGAAIEALRAGRREDAARMLRRVLNDFPKSAYAPQAALKVAEMLYPVSAWDQIGSAPPASIDPAIELFRMLADRYRASHEAARALVKLGYLGLEPANPKADLDEACARFQTAAQVYPDSEALDDAYFGSGMCEIVRDRPARAAEAFARLIQEIPASPLAEEALYRLGVALSHSDDPAEAMLALQQVRNRHPRSRFAALALARITLLHRMRFAAPEEPGGAGDPRPAALSGKGAAAGEAYRFDPDYGGGAGGQAEASSRAMRGVSDIDIDPQGLAVVASSRAPGVFRLDARGRVQERIDHPSPDFVAAGEGLSVYISGGEQIAVNTRNWSGQGLHGAGGRPPADWGPIAVDPAGRVHLLDRRENVVLIFDRSRRLIGSVRPASSKEGRFVDLAPGNDGGVFVLDGRARMVIELRQGKEAARIDLAALGMEDPGALAADALGDLFILDLKTGWVTVADPAGRRIAVIRPERAVTAVLGDPSTVGVDALGRIYVAGRKTGAVVRYR